MKKIHFNFQWACFANRYEFFLGESELKFGYVQFLCVASQRRFFGKGTILDPVRVQYKSKRINT